MIESWRWYGDLDAISLDEIAQTGARGIVTALHEIPYGEVWPVDTIAARKARITKAGFDGAKLLERTQDPEVKAKLMANTQAAVERGAFGVPTFFVGDEMFFGKDRLVQLEEEILR